MAGEANETSGATLYLRRSSGLVRVGGPWSSFAFNWIFTGNNVGIIAAFILLGYVFVSPGQSVPLLILAATLFSIFVPATYALFAIIMPRSGGDYHYIGRTLHPSLGFMSSWAWFVWLSLVIGWAASVVVPIALQSTLVAWGIISGNQALISLGSTITEPVNVFLIGSVVIVAFAVIQILGTKVYFRAQNVAFALMIVTLMITLGVFLTTTPSSMASRIDNLFGANAHSNLLSSFQTDVALPSPVIGDTLSGLALWTGVVMFAMGTSMIAGEIKNVKRSMLIGHVLSSLVLGASFALVAFLYFRAFGSDFIYAASYLYGGSTYTVGVPPYYNAFVGLLIDNPVIFVLFSVGFFLGGLWFIPQNIMLASRNMLAWSFDRLFPEACGKVDRRFRTPWVAIIIVTLIALISLWIYVFTDWLGLFSQLLALSVNVLLTGVAAIVFPFVKKDMFEASPVRWKVGPIPVMSLVGLGNVIYMLIFIWRNVVDSNLGANSPFSLSLIAGTFIVGFILFWIIWFVRSKQGLDLGALYKELPPE